MQFKLVEELNEDLKSKYGFSFDDLMQAAMNGNGDFVLNPPGVTDVINLSNSQWNDLYDVLFNTEEDTLYTDDEYEIEKENIHNFAKRYNCV